MAHVELVHRDPYECKVKGFRAVSSIERISTYKGFDNPYHFENHMALRLAAWIPLEEML